MVGGVPGGVPGGTPGGVIGGIIVGAVPSAAPPPPPAGEGGEAATPQRITRGRQCAAGQADPPAQAGVSAAGQAGAHFRAWCNLNAIIGKDGTIQNLKVVSGHPLLVPAAIEAVKQWVYQPTLLNGEPVEVVTQIDVNFTLSQ